MSEKEIDTQYTDEITCPYCGYENGDSWEFGVDSDYINCGNCDEEFLCEPQVQISYCTYKRTEVT